MIHGIGVDIVDVNRFRGIIERHGNKFAKRVLAESEYSTYSESKDKAGYLSKCWAVKEAFVKALGTGFNNEFTWQDISYTSPKYGRPVITLSEKSHNNSIMNNKTIHLSVSDEVSNVIAFVTIEEEK